MLSRIDVFWTVFIYTFFVYMFAKAFGYADGRDDERRKTSVQNTR